MSQSAVTQHVKKLEVSVGSKLLIRGQNGLSLTNTGKEIFKLAERHVMLERTIAEKIAGFSNLEDGYLKIIANPPVPALSLIAKFNARWLGFRLISPFLTGARQLKSYAVTKLI